MSSHKPEGADRKNTNPKHVHGDPEREFKSAVCAIPNLCGKWGHILTRDKRRLRWSR